MSLSFLYFDTITNPLISLLFGKIAAAAAVVVQLITEVHPLIRATNYKNYGPVGLKTGGSKNSAN